MRILFFILTILTTSLITEAQSTFQNDYCFSKANKKSIAKKMDKLATLISKETGCEKEKITFKTEETYTGFYTKKCKHLPKQVTADACGESRTYKHQGISGAVFYWLLGHWTLLRE